MAKTAKACSTRRCGPRPANLPRKRSSSYDLRPSRSPTRRQGLGKRASNPCLYAHPHPHLRRRKTSTLRRRAPPCRLTCLPPRESRGTKRCPFPELTAVRWQVQDSRPRASSSPIAQHSVWRPSSRAAAKPSRVESASRGLAPHTSATLPASSARRRVGQARFRKPSFRRDVEPSSSRIFPPSLHQASRGAQTFLCTKMILPRIPNPPCLSPSVNRILS